MSYFLTKGDFLDQEPHSDLGGRTLNLNTSWDMLSGVKKANYFTYNF